MRNYKDKTKAIELRKQGYSLNEIVDVLGVAKSTASEWVRNTPLSQKAEERLLTRIKAGQLVTQKLQRSKRIAKEKAAVERAKLLMKTIFFDQNIARLVCALLYFCEGQKSIYRGISFMNSDPGLMSLFLSTLRISFNLDESRFRVQVHLHEYHDKETQLNIWSEATCVPRTQFIKPFIKKSSGLYKKEGYQGCANVRYHDATVSRELFAIARECIAQQTNF